MQLEAGKRYITRDKDIAYIIGYDSAMTEAIGYIVRRSYFHKEDKDATFAGAVLTWHMNGAFLLDDVHDLDLTEEYIEPRSGSVKLWVYYSPTFGYMYHTTESDQEAPPANMLADMHRETVLVCMKTVEWSEDEQTT